MSALLVFGGRASAVPVIAVSLVLASGAGATPFALGVSAGEMTPTSAKLWTRADRGGAVVAMVAQNGKVLRCGAARSARGVSRRALTASPANDLTVQTRVTRLRPNSRYLYRFCQGRDASPIGRFRTAPSVRSHAPIDFAVTGDADGAIDPATGRPAYNNFEVYGRMAGERNAFNVNLGDTMYSDSAVAGVPPALSLADKWAKYRLNLSYGNLRLVRSQTGMYNQWDDHEWVDNFSLPKNGDALYRAGSKAFLDYMPATYTSRYGLYRSFRWGANLEIFFLDERSFRSENAEDDPVCQNPRLGAADPFPQLPQATRQQFFANTAFGDFPTQAQCAALIANPSRTLLGKPQLGRFLTAIKHSKAKFKVIMNEVPIQKMYFVPYDRWEGFLAEREAVLRYLVANVKNVVWLTTDLHATLINDVLFAGSQAGSGSQDTGMMDFVTGPVAKNSFGTDVNAKLGNPNAAQAVFTLFKAPRPAGLGMRCASLQGDSYVHVRVTRRLVTVAPLDQNGQPVREDDGAPCPPIPIPAR